MYNLRYHIASLVAVFLALAIGLLLGSVVVERGVLEGKGTELVKSLRTDFADIRKENADLRHDVDRHEAFARDAVPVLTRDLLAGRTVVVVTAPGRNDALSATRDALKDTGAHLVLATFKHPGYGIADATATGTVPSLPASGTPDAAAVSRALALEWTLGGARPMTDALVAAGELTLDRKMPDGPVAGVVLLATYDDAADPALVGLQEALRRDRVPAAAVEDSGGKGALIEAAIRAGIPTVDDVDSPEGALSLAWILAGRAEGHYGRRAGAVEPYPRLR